MTCGVIGRSRKSVGIICDLVYDIHALDDFAECSVSAIQMRGILVHDEELGACGVRMHGSGHGEDTLRCGVKVIFEAVLGELARECV